MRNEIMNKQTLVSIGPGAIALYRIPYLPHSVASDLQDNKLKHNYFNHIT